MEERRLCDVYGSKNAVYQKTKQVFRTKQAEALGSNPSESITNFLIKSLINQFKVVVHLTKISPGKGKWQIK